MSWLGRLLRKGALDRDLDRELRAHLDLLTDDLMRSGLSRVEATRRARITLGGVEQVKEASRDARGTRFVEDWWQDTRYALRALRRAPGFSAAAILTLAIGIGANTAVWSVLDALVFRALPVQRSDELYAIRLARLAGVFSGLALLLAAIGLYGVVAYSVSQRTNEMGIRMALGAAPSKLWRLVLRDSLGMVVVGLVVGLVLWVPLQGLVRNLVYGLSPRDPATLLFAVAVLAAVGVMAASLPAWRASRVDPARALRGE